MTEKWPARLIAIEEHYVDPELAERVPAYAKTARPLMEKLLASDEVRLADMDAAGIDFQILSHNHPGAQFFSKEEARDGMRRLNDGLCERIARNPSRFGGFASLAMAAPETAADELERCVGELGFHGAMLHGAQDGEFLDGRKFWPVFERAAALGVPIYLHPGAPNPVVTKAYYSDYMADFPIINSAGWGFGIETSTAAVRMVLSGVFEAFPALQVILGHLGEGLPFLLERTHAGFSGRRQPDKPYVDFRATFCSHFHVTTSGNFSDAALLCTLQAMGADRVIFSVDWPYNDSRQGAEWIRRTALSPDDRAKIMSGNAERLLKLAPAV